MGCFVEIVASLDRVLGREKEWRVRGKKRELNNREAEAFRKNLIFLLP